MTWDEVYNHPQYKGSSPSEWRDIRKRYFNDVVAPTIAEKERDEKWKSFNQYADGLERETVEQPRGKLVEMTPEQKKKDLESLPKNRPIPLGNPPLQMGSFTSEEIVNNPEVQAEIGGAIRGSVALRKQFRKAEAEGKDPMAEVLKLKEDRRGVWPAIKNAPGSTLTAGILRSYFDIGGKETETEKIWGPYEPEAFHEKVIQGGLAGALDAPYYAPGAALGAKTGNPILAGQLSMAIPEAIRGAIEAKDENLGFKDSLAVIADKSLRGFAEGTAFGVGGFAAKTIGSELATLKAFKTLSKAGKVGKSLEDFKAFRSLNSIPGYNVPQLGKLSQGALDVSAETSALAGSQKARGEDVNAKSLTESLVAMKLGNVLPHAFAKYKGLRNSITEKFTPEAKPTPESPDPEIKDADGKVISREDFVLENEIARKIADAQATDMRTIANGQAEVIDRKNSYDKSPSAEEKVYPIGQTDKEIIKLLPVSERKYMNDLDKLKYDNGVWGERLRTATETLIDSIDRHQDPLKVWQDPGTMDIDQLGNPTYAKLPKSMRKIVEERVLNTLEKRYSQRYAANKMFVEEQKANQVPYIKINDDPNTPDEPAPIPGSRLADRRSLQMATPEQEAANMVVDPDVARQADINQVKVRQIEKAWADEAKYHPESIEEAKYMFTGDPRLEMYGTLKDVPTKKINVLQSKHDIIAADGTVIRNPEFTVKSKMPMKEVELDTYIKLGEPEIAKKWYNTFTHAWTNKARKLELDLGNMSKPFEILFTDTWRAIQYNSKMEVKRLLGDHHDFIKENKYDYKDRVQVGKWMLWQDPDGQITLKNNGVKEEPVLTDRQKKYADYSRNILNKILNEINSMEEAVGIPTTQNIKNYISLIRLFEWGEKFGLKGSIFSAEREVDTEGNPRKVPFQPGKERTHENVRGVETDIARIIDRYIYESTLYKHKTPFIAKQRDLIALSDLGHTNPGLHNYIKKFLDYQSGIPQEIFSHPVWRFIIGNLNRNVALATIAYNTKVMGTQFSALTGAITEFGAGRTLSVGIPAMFNPKKWEEALRRSRHLAIRNEDILLEEARLGLTGRLGHAREIVADIGYRPIKQFDLMTAMATWWTAENYGRKVLGLKGRELDRYADKRTMRTQASADPIDMASVQYSREGKFATLFGTFGINKFNWLVREVVGRDNPNMTKAEAIRKTMKYVVATAAMNSLFEAFGSTPPEPAPVSKFIEEINKMDEDEKKTLANVLLRTALEGAEILPFGGRSGSWGGKGLLGAPGTLITELADSISGKPGAPPLLNTLMKFAGIPGTQQIFKEYRRFSGDDKPENNIRSRIAERRKARAKLRRSRRNSDDDDSIVDDVMNYRIRK